MIRIVDAQGKQRLVSLFALYAALARGEVMSFPALRPHQREPWHMFLVQTAAMALIRTRATALPQDEAAWRSALIGLTPQWPDGEAWSLVVEDWSRPALLQPPLARPADRISYKNEIATPDELDMLVTAKNHDVKAARMVAAADEDWLFALVTLQTMEGFLGAGNYGISRMNGGFASRMMMGVRPAGGPSTAFSRDVARLVEASKSRVARRDGLSLLWAMPWDGVTPLDFRNLDPLYVEICRRARLVREVDGTLLACTAGSQAARVAGVVAGKTGDPWAPINLKEDKSVTASPATFGYRKLIELLDASKTGRPVLAVPGEADDADGLTLTVAALVRGQGKTEGLHRRSLPLSRTTYQGRRGLAYLDRLGEVAEVRASQAGEVRRRLRSALFSLLQGGLAKPRLDDAVAGARAEPWLRRFDEAVDIAFFGEAFWVEFDNAPGAHRAAWRIALRDMAQAEFGRAADAAPRSQVRRERSRAVARNLLDNLLNYYIREAADE